MVGGEIIVQKELSLRMIPRVCERESEAMPQKQQRMQENLCPIAVTFHSATILRAGGRIITSIQQIWLANWAPFRIENPEPRDAS